VNISTHSKCDRTRRQQRLYWLAHSCRNRIAATAIITWSSMGMNTRQVVGSRPPRLGRNWHLCPHHPSHYNKIQHLFPVLS